MKGIVKTCQVCGLGMYDYSKSRCKKYCSDCAKKKKKIYAHNYYKLYHQPIKGTCILCNTNPIGFRKKSYCDECANRKHPVTGKRYSPKMFNDMLESKQKTKEYHDLTNQQQLTELMKCTKDTLNRLNN